MSFLEQIYDRPVTLDDVVTVVRFSQIIDPLRRRSATTLHGIGGAQN